MEALKMGSQVNSWNDDRLEELSRRTDEGFKEVKEEFKAVRGEIKDLSHRTEKGFDEVKETIKEVKGEVKELRQEFHRLNNSLLVASVGVIGTLLAIGIFG